MKASKFQKIYESVVGADPERSNDYEMKTIKIPIIVDSPENSEHIFEFCKKNYIKYTKGETIRNPKSGETYTDYTFTGPLKTLEELAHECFTAETLEEIGEFI